MPKSIKLAACAALLSTSLISSPALARHPGKTPIVDSTLTAQQICDLQLRPADPSEFSTFPMNEREGNWERTGRSQLGNPVVPEQRRRVGGGSSGNVQVTNDPYRNGGSPNIWVRASADVTYNMEKLYETNFEVSRTTLFDCDVTKIVGQGNLVDPHGLESYNNGTVELDWQVGGAADRVWRPDGQETDYGQTVYVLACISPNNTTKGKPGEWRGKHDFTVADCERFATMNLGPVPSYNSPDSYND